MVGSRRDAGVLPREPNVGLLVLFVITVVVAVAPALVRYSDRPGSVVVLAVLAIAFIVLGSVVFNRLVGRPGFAPCYLAIQTVLVLAMIGIGRGFGALTIALIPLAAQAGLILRRGPAVGYASLLTLLMPVPLLLRGRAFDLSLLGSTAAIGTGIFFGVLFAHLLRRESLARAEVERLNAEAAAANAKLRELAEQSAELATAEERNRIAREIHDSVGHALTTIAVQLEAAGRLADVDPPRARDMLDKARALAGQGLDDVRRSVAAMRTESPVERSLSEAVAQLAEKSQQTGLAVELSISGEPVDLSPQQHLTLYRAAQEALTNVRKHGAHSRAELTLHFAADAVRLSVRNPLETNGSATTAPSAGGGFGLIGIRERAQLLRGRLDAAARENGQFVFELEVPRRAMSEPSDSPIRVVLVDDQPLLREGLRTIFELRPDFEVVAEAGDGHEALQQVASVRPDVVLMDVQMPRVDGVQATRDIRSAHPGVQVIILTTFDDDEYVFEGLRAGACGYLLKDVSAERLLEATRAAARGESFLQPSVAAKVVAEFSRISSKGGRQAAANSALDGPLTRRELEVLGELGAGKSNREIARVVHLSEGTVKNHVTAILQKLGAGDRAAAVERARALGLL